MIKLYGIPASRTSRCIWMLEELGVKYENIPTNFIGEAQKPDYLKLNPNGRVPTLDDERHRLFESLAMNLHLARKYGKGYALARSRRTISRALSSGASGR